MQPKRPKMLPLYAERCLQALDELGLGDKLSIGGAFGLMHYFEYRPTHDVDAWWVEGVSEADQRKVIEVLEEILHPFGRVRSRTWGDVASVELSKGSKLVFSFQIAGRSAQLEESQASPWGDLLLDSFTDLVASKMVALVERGAPRDFRDIYMLCKNELTTPEECWQFWQRRQDLTGSDKDMERARLAVETHLARIEQHRPLGEISDDASRQAAKEIRSWIKDQLLGATGG
jgi:hypothetical protein